MDVTSLVLAAVAIVTFVLYLRRRNSRLGHND
jgi:hypothetical protein